jgi:hypothetical protein
MLKLRHFCFSKIFSFSTFFFCFFFCLSIVSPMFLGCEGAKPQEKQEEAVVETIQEAGEESVPEAVQEAVQEAVLESQAEVQPEKEPLRWGESALRSTLAQGRIHRLALPARMGGQGQSRLSVEADGGWARIEGEELVIRLPYEEAKEQSAKVIAEDEAGEKATLEVTIFPYTPRFLSWEIAAGGPTPRANPAMAMTEKKLLVFSGYLESGGGSSEMWISDREQLTWTLAKAEGDIPPSFGAYRMAISVDTDELIEGIIAQGSNEASDTVNRDIYRFQIRGEAVNWKRLTSEGDAPGEVLLSALGYDAPEKRFVFFGGLGQSPMSAVWLLKIEEEKARWTRVVLTDGPSARYGMAFAMDAQRRSLWIFGGDTLLQTTRFPGDLWRLRLDGLLRWEQIAVKGSIAGRRNGALLLDTAGNRLFVWSGASGNSAPVGLFAVSLDDVEPTWENIPYQGPSLRTSVGWASENTSSESAIGFGRTPSFLGDVWLFAPNPPRL